ncbi:MAG TPA: hypothetical protein VL422_00100 [Miltoncostaea sp.]|nr:hypothetical protein [Miltoncostaea sp.]
MSAAAGALAGLLLLVACGGGPSLERTTPVPPDRLQVTAEGGGGGRFQVELDCAVADHAACAGVLAALASADDPQTCSPAAGGDRRLVVVGTIDGDPIRTTVERRTDCEIAAYDAAARAAGL